MIERARAVPIESVIEGLKLRGRVERCGPCPVCGGDDRFNVNVRKQAFFCRMCGAKGNVIALVQFLDGVDFRKAVEVLTGERASEARRPSPPAPSKTDDDLKRRLDRDLARARRIVSELVPVVGTPGERNLRDVRKIDVDVIKDVLSRTDAIGWHPAVYFNEPEYPRPGDPPHPLHGQKLGCIVAVMTDPVTARPTGAISRTYIGPDGKKVGKAKTLASPMGIVRLTPDDEVLLGLHICEGLESALDGMARDLRPMWSTGSTALMSKFPVLAGIEALTILADHDANGAGEKAAREAGARWRAVGREVRVYRTAAPGDINDIARGAGR
jgi:hypothetical protein